MNMPVANPIAASAVNLRDLVSPRGVALLAGRRLCGAAGGARIRASAAARAQDPAGKAGALTMLAGLLDEGAGDLDDQAFQQRARREGDRDSPSTPSATISADGCSTLVRHLDRAGELLRLAVNAPRFDEAPFERVREQIARPAPPRGQRARRGRRPRLARAGLSRPSLCAADQRHGREPRRDRARRPAGAGASG